MTATIPRCPCDNHEAPLFARCNAKLEPDETTCAWCRNGHVGGLGTFKAIGRTLGKAFRLWVQRKFPELS